MNFKEKRELVKEFIRLIGTDLFDDSYIHQLSELQLDILINKGQTLLEDATNKIKNKLKHE